MRWLIIISCFVLMAVVSIYINIPGSFIIIFLHGMLLEKFCDLLIGWFLLRLFEKIVGGPVE